MKYIFGPISSRRFGMSLGIDLSPDKKSCNFDCIYCELEKAQKVDTIYNPPKVEDIINDVKEGIKKYDFDVITITANGEPTLYPFLDELIDEINKIKKDKKSLILSNSSNIDKPEIQNAIKKLDIVKLSLDSVNPKTFKKIDRALEGIKIENIINGIKEFSKIYRGDLIIEILVVKGINDKIEEFQKLNEVLKEINPTRVDISTIDRPPAYDVQPVEYERLFELSQEIKNQHIFIASRKNLENKKESFTKEELAKTLSKRPFSEDDIKNILDDDSKKVFYEMLENDMLKEKVVANTKFFTTKGFVFE
jgi:wyosine [tRNA(Phe)-imidazoG37] synthetase (radical SAM superfamily)